MLGVQSNRESRNDGAKKRCEVGQWRDQMRRHKKTCRLGPFSGRDPSLLVVSLPIGQK
jgi:hypothetical protein